MKENPISTASSADVAHLEKLYSGLAPYHGELHNHAATGGTSDGKCTLSDLSHLREGDFTCGPVGVRMCMGDTKTGGQCAFNGQMLTVCASDFHESVCFPDHEYRLDILSDQGLAFSAPVSLKEENFVSIPADPCAFYRAEVFDVTRNLRIAIGNPIWNRSV